jgi:D-glycero-D-manno-heptose 1,7-bisphosphate phosphatase
VTSVSGFRAAFLDRDGVINLDRGYVHRVEDFQFLPGALTACRDLHTAGYRLIVVTNQAGIARGYYDEQTFQQITTWMSERFYEVGAPLTGVYYCPHHPDGKVSRFAIECACRKPAPGMILQAAIDHQIDVSQSILVGDKASDLEAGERAGVSQRYLVWPPGSEAERGESRGFRSLSDVVQFLLQKVIPEVTGSSKPKRT